VKLGIDCRDLIAGSLNGIGRFVGNFLRAVSLTESPPDLVLYGNQHTQFELPDDWGAPIEAETRRAGEAATWWWDRVTLPRLVRRDRLDVFLSPYFKVPSIKSCPVVNTIHDLLFMRMPPAVSGRSAVYCRAFRSFAASFAERAAAVMTVSEYSARDVAELLDVPQWKIHIVGNCIGPEFHPGCTHDQIDAARQACDIGKPYIMYVGNFGPHKNVEGLLQAFADLDETLRNGHQLLLVGREDKWTPQLRQAASGLGIGSTVRMPGHVPDEHLPALYAGTSAVVTLSRWEGFGLPVVEAMACGAPVMCSDRASLPEVAGGAALLVDPDSRDACSTELARLLTDSDLRDRLRAKGLERATAFAPSRFAELVMKTLNAVVEAKRR
jgi:glycosyltransferase involved in cell wall biosynthesis